jgi:hypothetical protein
MTDYKQIFQNYQNDGSQFTYQVDSTLIKIFLNIIKDGELDSIKSYIQKYNFDIKLIKDEATGQNVIFYAVNGKCDEK